MEAKKKRSSEIRQLLLTSEKDDERLLAELGTTVSHPEPANVIFDIERSTEEEFLDVMLNDEPVVLPFTLRKKLDFSDSSSNGHRETC